MPGGTVGSSGNSNVGIHVNNPDARLDVQANNNVGALQLRTTQGEGLGGSASTPFAVQVLHTAPDVNNNLQTTTTVKLLPNGVLSLGNISNLSPTQFLNIPSLGLGIYKSEHANLTLSYGNIIGLPMATLNWNSNGETGSAKNFRVAHNKMSLIEITPEGKVGIGEQVPIAKLTVVDNSATNTTGSAVYGIQINNNGWRNEDYAINVNTAMGNVMRLTNSGYLYLGENLNGAYFDEYRLYVQTGIRTERVRVDVSTDNGWADFVFEDDYILMPITELEAFIKEHKHLPNVPSAAQVQTEGIDLAEMNAILLRQIEELTLRVIELEKKVQ